MVFFLIFLANAHAFKFYLPPLQVFCFAEDLTSQILAIVELTTQYPIRLTVTDSEQYTLYDSKINYHKYSFTSLESGVYKFCIDNERNSAEIIEFSFKSGVKAKDYSGIAKTKELKSVELKMKKLMDQVKDIHNKIQVLREREEEMRNTNVTIHNRVIGYSISTLAMLVCLTLVQILYLKRFFRAKKMI